MPFFPENLLGAEKLEMARSGAKKIEKARYFVSSLKNNGFLGDAEGRCRFHNLKRKTACGRLEIS
jgi:hypothetical protein